VVSPPGPAGQVRELRPDLDPSLPGLARALHTADVIQRFELNWPGPGHAPSIKTCVLDRVHWTPGAECVATYRVNLASPVDNPVATIVVVAVGLDGVRHRIFAEDTDLPGLSAAADPGLMNDWLTEQLGRPVKCRSVTPVTYQPGSRCTLRYVLSDSRDTVLYGKVLPARRAQDLVATIGALGYPLVASLVGFAPEWNLVVQVDAGGRSLRDAAAAAPSDQSLAELDAGGRLLARLHARSGPPARQRSLADDADELQKYLPATQLASPAKAALLAKGIDRVRSLADQAGATAPSHGAFRLDQVQINDAGPVLIDLDSYCWAEPARDLGNLLAYLRWSGIRRPNARLELEEVRAAFLAGYDGGRVGPRDDNRIRAFEAASLLKIAGRRYRKLPPEHLDRAPELIDAALTHLGAGAGRLS
jgi:Phosphotransferase enzyme family